MKPRGNIKTCQHQGRSGARVSGMVNTCERLINVVTRRQAKDADKLEPKGTVAGRGFFDGPLVDTQRHRRIERTQPILLPLRNTVSPISSVRGRQP